MRLQYPLNNFWISEPYQVSRGFIGVGKLDESELSRTVTSVGDGEVMRVDVGYMSTRHRVEGQVYEVELFNLTEVYVVPGEQIKRGLPIATIDNPHLRIRTYTLGRDKIRRQVNPWKVLYTVPTQIHRNHIPRHYPKPIPKKFLE